MNNFQAASAADTENAEWQLAELVDAITAEIDKAADTLSLKSYARGMSFAIKQLDLDLEVLVRRDQAGRVLFRTVEADQPSATVLKLNFAQVLQSQLQGTRRQFDQADTRPLTTLQDVSEDEIVRLNAIAIYSVDDLDRYTQTGAMLAETSRKTGIADARLRFWRRLPFLSEIKPAQGAPGSSVLIEGGNFGSERDANAVFLFQGQPATIQSWSDSRITLTMPQITGKGMFFGVIATQPTNTLDWQATAVDLLVRGISVTPTVAGRDTLDVAADLVNQGAGVGSGFVVEWLLDGQSLGEWQHGPLQPGQRSQEMSTRMTLQPLAQGEHTISFTADPHGTLSDVDPANSTFTQRFTVEARQTLMLGDYRSIETLDAQTATDNGPGDVLRLMYRGLQRQTANGALELDIAAKVGILHDEISVYLRKDAIFHDGSPVTASDVVATYAALRLQTTPLGIAVARFISTVRAEDARTVIFTIQAGAIRRLPAIVWTAPVLALNQDNRFDRLGSESTPLGCGPYQLESFELGKRIVVRAFPEYYAGKPRIDSIDIESRPTDELLQALKAKSYHAVIVPYDQAIARAFADDWTVSVVEQFGLKLLYIQSKTVLERAPNPFDSAWNAYLWYFAR